MAALRPTSEMKDSGIEWAGIIPGFWNMQRLKNLVTHLTDKADTNTGYIGLENVESFSGKFVSSTKENFEAEGISLAVKKGDLIFGKLRPYLAKCAIVEQDGCCSTEFVVMRADKCSGRFLKYIILSPMFIDTVNMSTYGAKMPRANWDFIGNMMIPFPSLSEQHAIASYLDDRCSKLDEIITEAEKSIEEYKELKQAVIFEAVTKGLDKNVPMKDSGFHWVGNIPSHWKMMKLKYLLDKSDAGIKVGPFGSSFTNKTVGDGDYLIYGQANVISRDFSKTKNSVTADVYHTLSRYDVVSGDICLSVIGNGTIGWCCTVPENIKPGIMDSHLMKIRLNDLIINDFFELYYSKHYAGVCHTQMQYEKTGIAMEGLNTRIVKGLWMAVPPVDEQQRIVEKMMPFIKNMDSIISEKQSLIEDLKVYKKSLIYEVVTGKRRVV